MKALIFGVVMVLLVGCSTPPRSVSPSNVSSLNHFELCRAFFSANVSQTQKRTSGIYGEVERRGFDYNSCFKVIVTEVGMPNLCTRAVNAELEGDDYFSMDHTTSIGVSGALELAERMGADCYSYHRDQNTGQSTAGALLEVFEAFNESYNPSQVSPTRSTIIEDIYSRTPPSNNTYNCRTRADGSVSCSGSGSNVVCREMADGSVKCTSR